MIEINKEEFEQFVVDNFPGKQYCYGENYFFIQAGTFLGNNLHYEYNNDKMQLHIEGWNWREIRNFLYNRLRNNPKVSSNWWGRNNCAWTLLNTELSDWEDVKRAFIEIDKFMNPYIEEYENQLEIQREQTNDAKNSNSSIQAHFVTIRDCLEKKLAIPHYQRPYRWTEHNVEQLLDDIAKNRNDGKLQYLVGSIILHKHNDIYDIVDGQQRITTLLLLLKAFDNGTYDIIKDGVQELKYNHSDSIYHIRENFNFIKVWIAENIGEDEKTLFSDFVLGNCLFVEVAVTDLHEAFQMFESQNGRGKELEAYNLLKAYHLRAMSDAIETEKIACDIRWENAAIYGGEHLDLLRQVFNEHLYRSRLWTRGEDAYQFSKRHLDEFKGFTLNRGKGLEYVYQNILIQQELANSFMRNINMNMFPIRSRFIYGDPDNVNPFVRITQLIVDGKAFFDYVETYVEIYKRLFLSNESSQLSKFKTFYNDHCLYKGSQRSGDTYVREVYKAAIMMLFDRFGEDGVNKFYKDIYVCLYQYRIGQKAVRYKTMANKEKSSWIFRTIEYSKTLSDLYAIRKKSQELKKSFEENFHVQEIIDVFNQKSH